MLPGSSAADRPAHSGDSMKFQRGGFVMGLIIGLMVGLAVALGVALYVTKVPIPFVNKVPQRTAEQDAAEAEKNRNWDPNSPLYGKNPARPNMAPVSPRGGAADAGAANEKTDKHAQSTKRRQQQHDAVIAWHGKPTGGNLAVIIKALGVDQNRTQSAHDRCGYFVEFVDFKQDRRVAIKQSSLPYKKILVRRATH